MAIRYLLKDESAVVGLPVRILMALILFSVILGLSINAGYSFIDDMKEKKLQGELDIIEKHAAAMYLYGGARDINNPEDIPGTIENINVDIPDNAAFVVFGAMPEAGVSTPERRDLYEDNVYYYVLANGRVQIGYSIARFSANDTDLNSPVVLYPGEYELTLELLKNNNGTYVKIEQNQWN